MSADTIPRSVSVQNGVYAAVMHLSERFDEALLFAAQLHRKQLRHGSRTPYLSHLLSAASIALEYGATETEAIAALLHDTVEDQGGERTAALVKEKFGEEVHAIVMGCTDGGRGLWVSYRDVKQRYVDHLAEPGTSRSILLVSASDKLHNARSILRDVRIEKEKFWKRWRRSKADTLWYYQSLVEVYRKTFPHPLTDELERTVRELTELAGE